MRLNKEISSIFSILIILIAGLIGAFFVHQATDIGKINIPDLNYENKKDTVEENNNKEEENSKEKEDKPKVSIIIDDLGNNFEIDKTISNVNENLTLAILPKRENTIKSAKYLNSFERFELLIHLPLEPIAPKDAEEDMLMTSMDKKETELKIEEYLDQLGEYVVGANNHKGSKYTSNEEKMSILLKELKRRSLFFVDSFTYKDSVAYNTAKEIDLKTAKRDVFLDNVDEKEKIKEKLKEAIELAKEKGEAIAIGHSKPNTISVLKEEIPKNNEVDFVKVSEIIK